MNNSVMYTFDKFQCNSLVRKKIHISIYFA
jgi:hypothetical protein